MTTAFTPGPWLYRPQEFDDWGVVRMAGDDEGRQWIVANARRGMPNGVSDDEHRSNGTDPYETNGRLIAAAPDLYKALGVFARLDLPARRQGNAGFYSIYSKDIEAARFALIKALGGPLRNMHQTSDSPKSVYKLWTGDR